MSTKLKNILSETKWGKYNIQPGQVVTAKDFPPFKTPTQIQEEEALVKNNLKLIKLFEQKIKDKMTNIWGV